VTSINDAQLTNVTSQSHLWRRRKTEPKHWTRMFSENVWNTAGTQIGNTAQLADCCKTQDQTKKTRGHQVWLSVFWGSPVRCRRLVRGTMLPWELCFH